MGLLYNKRWSVACVIGLGGMVKWLLLSPPKHAQIVASALVTLGRLEIQSIKPTIFECAYYTLKMVETSTHTIDY